MAGDTYYLYATTDGTGNGYGPAQVWVSKDFQNWKNIVMNWPTTEVVWAPDVVQQPDGTFRYYYCEPCAVSIGESKSPVGPWKNILGKEDAVMVPDRYVHNVITLDPQTYYVSEVPMEINIPLFVLLNIATLLISIFVLIAPSFLISHIHPAKSMRYE